MTQGKARDKGARESKVLEDVLSLCLSSGGQRAPRRLENLRARPIRV